LKALVSTVLVLHAHQGIKAGLPQGQNAGANCQGVVLSRRHGEMPGNIVLEMVVASTGEAAWLPRRPTQTVVDNPPVKTVSGRVRTTATL